MQLQSSMTSESRVRKQPIRIVVLTSETPANAYLVNQIVQRHDVVGIVVESPPLALGAEEKRQRRRRMLRRYGLFRTLNKLAFNWARGRFISHRQARIFNDAFNSQGERPPYSRTVPVARVSNINDPECTDLLKTQAPDLIAVCGTSVIKPHVFTTARLGAINIHTGITPEYRSADPIFWALYHGDARRVGVTIHHVDAGIDTGAIIHQDAVRLYSDDSLATITARCIHRGAELYLQTLNEIEAGKATTIDRSNVKGRAFYSIDLGIVQYVIFRWRFRRLKRSLPHTPIPERLA